jgi:hypothetical protein
VAQDLQAKYTKEIGQFGASGAGFKAAMQRQT